MPPSHLQLRARAFDPRRFRQLQLWLDPRWTNGMRLSRVAEFRRATGAYLSTPAAAPLQATTALTVEFWKNSVSLGLDRAYVGHGSYNTSGGGGWNISSGDGVNGGNSIKVYLALNANFSVIASGVTPQATLAADWSQCVVVYNGGGATSADRLKVYLDGVAQSLTFSGTIPATLFLPTVPLEVGRFAGLPGRELDAGMQRLRLWTVALSAAQASALYNTGAGHSHAQLAGISGLAAPAAAWELQESSGARADSGPSGLTLQQQNGTVASGLLTTEVRDRGPRQLVLTAPLGTAPRWSESEITGKPGWRTHGRQFLSGTISDWLTAPTGDLLQVAVPLALESAPGSPYDHGLLASGVSGSTDRYAFSLFYKDTSNVLTPRLRIRNQSAPNGFVIGNSALTLGQRYVLNWRGATGGTDGYALRLNGQAVGLTVQSGLANTWFDDVPARDKVALGAFITGAIVQGMGQYQFGQQLAFGPGLSQSANRAAERWLGV
ncbi:MAG: hypothetical protein SFX18_01705 [Pirellulales bacterium]|nr:hypothetical protein [Pirellulales bacterium]